MSSGPSKEELEMYWKTSRSYFDELAKYYKNSDPAYYNKFIEPFYSNPFIANNRKKSRGAAVFGIMVTAIALLIAVAAAGILFFITSEQQPGTKQPQIEKKAGEELEKKSSDSVNTIPGKEIEPRKNNNRKKRIERVR